MIRAPLVYKAAAIDVGSSATRLSILQVTFLGVVAQTEFKRYEMRLGADVFSQGRVSAARQQALVDLFAQMAQILRKNKIRHYRAVATSAMRDATNAAAVVAAIEAACGLRLSIISGQQEGALARQALVRALGSVDPAALLVDLGGGSLELERLSLQSGHSIPMGTVRLLALFPQLRHPLTPAVLQTVTAAIAARLQAAVGPVAQAPQAIGTGGDLEVLAKVLGGACGLVSQFEACALPALAAAVAPTSLNDRVATYHVRPDRADLFLPAVLVLQALAAWYKVERFIVPHTGLREALLMELLPPGVTPQVQSRTLNPLLQVTMALFDLLFVLHGLWPPARRCLAAVVYRYNQGLAATVSQQPQGADDAVNQALTREEKSVYCTTLAQLNSKQPPPLPANGAYVAQVFAGLVQLADAIVAQHVAVDVAPLCQRLRLNILQQPIFLHVGTPLAAHVVQPLEHALGHKIVLC